MSSQQVVLITGSRKGIGRYLAKHFLNKGSQVIGCSRSPTDFEHPKYRHYELDITSEKAVKELFKDLRKSYGRLDTLVNNAGIAIMNHSLLTPASAVEKMLNTNVLGTFLFCREAAKIMRAVQYGRVVNFTTVAAPLKLEGEAVYASSKAAVITLTEVLARELAPFGITVNAIGPTAIKTDLIRNVPENKLEQLIQRQAVRRFGEFADVANVVDFFVRPESDFVTGQVLFLGGV